MNSKQKELRTQREKIRTLIHLAKKLGDSIEIDGQIITIQELQLMLSNLDQEIAAESSKLDHLEFMPNKRK